MPLDGSARVRRREGLDSSPLDDELVILNLPRDSYVGLDPIGRRIWELLAVPCTVDELCHRLAGEYDAPAGQVELDVRSFLDELLAEGLVDVVTPKGP